MVSSVPLTRLLIRLIFWELHTGIRLHAGRIVRCNFTWDMEGIFAVRHSYLSLIYQSLINISYPLANPIATFFVQDATGFVEVPKLTSRNDYFLCKNSHAYRRKN